MALGPTSLKQPSVLQQLLEEINFQRTKEMRQLLKDDSGFVVLQGTTYWTDLFVRHFLFQTEVQNTIDCDDLLFFVRKKHVKGSSRYLPKFETEVDVFRKDSRKLPIGDPDIDWEETVYLNLVIHQFDYTLTLAICTRTSPKELQVLRRHSQKVYASPSRRKMDTKGEGEEMTYPHICFMVDNFDEVFCDILVRDGEMVCVELVARDRDGSVQGVIFLGSIRYDALKKVYDARQSSLSTKVAQRMTFGLFSNSAAQRCEFVRMKGPQGKGHAEMAVTKPRGSGVETPTSEPGYSYTDAWDEWEDDPEEYFNYRHQRRLSDPSANLNNFSRGGWKTRAESAGAKSLSENEGLDSMGNGMSEIEAGDLRDDCPASSTVEPGATSGCFCWRKDCTVRRESAAMSEVYCRSCENMDSPACLVNVTLKTSQTTGQNLLNIESELEVPGKNGHKFNDIVNSPKKLDKKDCDFTNCNENIEMTRKKSFKIAEGSKKLEYEIADDATSLNIDPAVLESETKLGVLGDLDPELVINVHGTEELPSETVNTSTVTKSKTVSRYETRSKIINKVDSKVSGKRSENNGKIGNKSLANRKPFDVTNKPNSVNLKLSNKSTKIKDNKTEVNKIKPSILKDKSKTTISTFVSASSQRLFEGGRNRNLKQPEPIRNRKSKDVEIKNQKNDVNDNNGNQDINMINTKDESTDKFITENKTEDKDSITNDNVFKKCEKDNSNLNNSSPTDRLNDIEESATPDVCDCSKTDQESLNKTTEHIDTHVCTCKSNLNSNKQLSQFCECLISQKGKVPEKRAYCTLPKRKRDSLHHSMWYREPMQVPMRTTPDGTDIYYWCDLPKRHSKARADPEKLAELDDGAYNPLWAMRGFTQTFHFWKENKRQQSTPLNAFLTYVTLPWWSIAKDILDHREGPILTF